MQTRRHSTGVASIGSRVEGQPGLQLLNRGLMLLQLSITHDSWADVVQPDREFGVVAVDSLDAEFSHLEVQRAVWV